MILRSHDEIMAHVKYLKQIKEPFTMYVTNNRYEIHSRLGSFMNRDATFPSNEIFLIRQVYDYIVKSELYKSVPETFKNLDARKNIQYFAYNKRIRPGKQFRFEDDEMYEVDLKTAYWEMLNKMGLLTEEIYARGQEVSKKTRLAAAGALARVVDKYEFDGTKSVKDPEPERRELTEHIWFEVCDRTAKLLSSAVRASGQNFLFYWVDAIFIRSAALPAVKAVFEQAGFNFSVHKVKSVAFGEKTISVRGKLVDRKMSDWTIKKIKFARKALYPGMKELPKNALEKIQIQLGDFGGAIPPAAIRAVLNGHNEYKTDQRPFPYRDPSLTTKEIHKHAA